MASREYCDYVLDVLDHIGGISARRMFGGFGLYRDGAMFGLIADDVLYFKVGPGNQEDYEDAGSEPFTYRGKNKPVQMSFWRVPEDVLEDGDEARTWVLKASDAALKAKAAKSKPHKTNKKTTKKKAR